VTARVTLAVSLAVAVLALGSSAGAAPASPSASSRAAGVRVVVPGGPPGVAGAISSPPQAAASLVSYTYGDGAVVTGAIETGTRAVVDGDRSTAAAAASVRSISLFGGEVTADAVDLRAVSRAFGTRAAGRLTPSALTNVTVLGRAVQPRVNARVALADWGYAVLLEQAVVRQSVGRWGYRGFVTGIHVHLIADHGGLPAGSQILIGYAEAAATAPKVAQPPPPPPPSGGRPPPEPVPLPPGAPPPAPPPVVQEPPPGISPQLTARRYVFPVYGPSSFTDDFRAGRADTGWHHGNDIFAPLGAPILAVADGELFRVGWNTIGGNRLWLRDGEGNEFYYAHLSAFSPLAREGARVRAGDVVGFVGATGDAVGTPTHLHFEIHPVELLWLGYDGVINPFPYLLAWRRLLDASFDISWRPPPGKAPAPGAVLLLAEDISTISGLAGEGYARVLAPFDFGEAPPGPKIVTAAPGFEK
jgi:hypothetical protein